MKALVRWGAILSLVGSTVLGPSLAQQMSAIALPESQVIEQLSDVPLFILTDQKGAPFSQTIASPDDKTKQVMVYPFFVSQQDAQLRLNNLKTKQPDLAKVAKVTPVSLGKVLQFALDNQKKKANVGINIIPSKAQMDLAIAVLKQNGKIVDKGGQFVTKEGKPFDIGTPLFYVADAKTGGPLGLNVSVKEKNGQTKTDTFIPLYFDKQDLQTTLDGLKKQQPDLATTTRIDVWRLDDLVGTLLSSNDPSTGKLQLVPSKDSIDYVMQQQKTPGAVAPAPAGAAQPAIPTSDKKTKTK
jgi:Tic22-like family